MEENNVTAYPEKKFTTPYYPKPHIVNALLAQCRGEHSSSKCGKCEKGQGKFTFCIKVAGEFHGGCGNCTDHGM